MRGGRKGQLPAGALISLGSKPKRSLPSSLASSHGSLAKKPKGDHVEGAALVDANELVSRVEEALASGNTALAESLVLGALTQIHSSVCPNNASSSAGTAYRALPACSSGSRLPICMSLGLLISAQSHPVLFARPAIKEMLVSLLALSLREMNTASATVYATIAARTKGLHVFIANILYLALASEPRWPSQLIKIYLDDSLGDRLWVDQDECRAFVLNLETAFPPVYGNPRGIFTLLTAPSTVGLSVTSGSSSSSALTANAPANAAVHTLLGLSSSALGLPSTLTESTNTTTSNIDDVGETVSSLLKTMPNVVAKIVHGTDPAELVIPRFEACRTVVDIMISSTLRDCLSRRGSGGSSQVSGVVATSSPSAGSTSTSTAIGAASIGGGGPAGGGEVSQLRNLIRSVAMAVGIPEVRSFFAAKLEPWLTNPKVQLFTVALMTLLALNCRLGGSSPYDMDMMISFLYRIRYKLLKPNVQAALLESLAHLVKASAMNLYCLVHLGIASEFRGALATADNNTTTSTGVSEPKPVFVTGSVQQEVKATVYKIAENVRSLSDQRFSSGGSSTAAATASSLSILDNVAQMAGSCVSSRTSLSVIPIIGFLQQRFPLQWVRIVGNLIHERVVAAVTAKLPSTASGHSTAGSGFLADSQLIDELRLRLRPIAQLLRELSRRSAELVGAATASGGGGVVVGQPQQQQHNQQSASYIPCSELAAVLLHDRAHRSAGQTAMEAANCIVAALNGTSVDKTSSSSSSTLTAYQLYIYSIVTLVSGLQMLSANRPYLVGAPGVTTAKRSNQTGDAMKAHQTTLRQIRLAFLRWLKAILPVLVNVVVQLLTKQQSSTASSSQTDLQTAFFTCLEAVQPSLLIRRGLMLDAGSGTVTTAAAGGSQLPSTTAPVTSDATDNYQLSSFYPVREIWGNDMNYSLFTRLVANACLPEKLAHQLLLLGLEPNWQLLTATDASDMVCELVRRAAVYSADTGVEALVVTKPERLINLLYASCLYVPEQQLRLPPEMSDLAHAPLYWRISLSAVILAACSPHTCGLHLWSQYPTVRRLMEMVITGDYSQLNDLRRDTNTVESERLNSEMELQLILRLESLLLAPDTRPPSGSEGKGLPQVTEATSRLVGRLLWNPSPQGPCRLPPPDQIAQLRLLSDRLGLDRRLWTCRQPDFLLELLRTQQASDIVVQPWIARLVESSGDDFDLLPVQCLCEYLVSETVWCLQNSRHEDVGDAGVQVVVCRHFGIHTAADGSSQESQETAGAMSKRRRVLANLQTFITTAEDGIFKLETLTQSFFSRLHSPQTSVREAVRQCLRLLVVETFSGMRSSNVSVDHPIAGCSNWLSTLQRLHFLLASGDGNGGGSGEERRVCPELLLSALLASLQIEVDLDVLTASLVYLASLTVASFNLFSWRSFIQTVTRFITGRPRLVSRLLHTDDSISQSTLPAALEALCEIYVRYLEYNCTAAEAIPVDERTSVFVSWSPDRQCPLEVDVVHAQLRLLTHTHCSLPEHVTQSSPSSKATDQRSWWCQLRDNWFLASEGEEVDSGISYRLPTLIPFVLGSPEDVGKSGQQHISFDQAILVDGSPRLVLSADLRAALVTTNQPALISGALNGASAREFADLLQCLPIFLVSSMNATTQLLCHADQLTDKAALHRVDHIIDQLRQKLTATCVAPPTTVQSIDVPMPEVQAGDLGDSPPPWAPSVSSSWSHLFEACRGDSGRAETVQLISYHLAHQLAHKRGKQAGWTVGGLLDQLDQELKWLESSSTAAVCGGAVLVDEHTAVKLPQLISALSSCPTFVRVLQPLLAAASCFPQSPECSKYSDLGRRVGRLVVSQPPTGPSHIDTIVGCLQALFNLSPQPPKAEEPVGSHVTPLSHGRDEDDSSECQTGRILDLVCLFGLSKLALPSVVGQTDNGSSDDGDLLSTVIRTVFHASSTGNTDGVSDQAAEPLWRVQPTSPACRQYLLAELLNQADPVLLRRCLTSLLQSPNIDSLNSSRVLDFATALLTLPRLSYPVPRAEPRDRPDSATALTELHCFTLPQACHLVEHVLSELVVVGTGGADQAFNLKAVDQVVKTRISLLDLVLSTWHHACLLLLETSAGFVPARSDPLLTCPVSQQRQPEEEGQVSTAGRPRARASARLLTALYCRWPGLIDWLHSPVTRRWLRFGVSPAQMNLPAAVGSSFPVLELERLGPLLLVGLTSSTVPSVSDMAELACRALVTSHPMACLRLLPMMAGLCEGRLEVGTTWAQFSGRRHHFLFSNLLHLLELLVMPIGGDDVDGIESSPLGSMEGGSLSAKVNAGHLSCDNDYNQSVPLLFSQQAAEYFPSLISLFGNLVGMLTHFRSLSRRRLGGLSRRLARILNLFARWAPATVVASFLSADGHRTRRNLELLAEEFNDFALALSALLLCGSTTVRRGTNALAATPSLLEGEILSGRKGLRWVIPCLRRLQTATEAADIVTVLEDLDEESKRHVDILTSFKTELGALLSHRDSSVSTAALQLLLRLLRHQPRLADSTVTDAVLPWLSGKLSDPGCSGIGCATVSNAIFSAVPDLCLLAPRLAPRLLSACARCLLLGHQTKVTGQVAIGAVEQALQWLSLNGLDAVAIEHAASVFVSRALVLRGGGGTPCSVGLAKVNATGR